MLKTVNNQKPWFILKTKARHEELASHSLEQYGITSYLPRLLVNNNKHHTLRNVALFPGYIFFQLEPGAQYWSYIRWAPGISYVLKDAQGPIPVSVELVSELKTRELAQQEQKHRQLKEPFNSQERLQILTGPFEGVVAVFEKPLSASGRVQVLIEILGQFTRIQLDKVALSRI